MELLAKYNFCMVYPSRTTAPWHHHQFFFWSTSNARMLAKSISNPVCAIIVGKYNHYSQYILLQQLILNTVRFFKSSSVANKNIVCQVKSLGMIDFQKGAPSAESSRSVRGLGKSVSDKPYPSLCNAKRPRLKSGTIGGKTLPLAPDPPFDSKTFRSAKLNGYS